MLKRLLTISMLLAAMLAYQAPIARAQDDVDPVDVAHGPEDLFEKCVKSIRKLVHRCDHRTKSTVRECVPKIKRLLEAGNREEARALAARCIAKIERQSNQCVELVKRRCERCIDALLDMGAPRLAHRLRGVCQDAVEHLRTSERRAIHAIKSLFD